MAEYIERRPLFDALFDADAITVKGINIFRNFPAADVVARDCYDHLLAENDELRKVRPVVRGKWEKGTGENGVTTSLFCSVCHYENTHWREWNFCPNCGADMREGS